MATISRRGVMAGLGAASWRPGSSAASPWSSISGPGRAPSRAPQRRWRPSAGHEWSVMHWVDPALDEAIIARTIRIDLKRYFANAVRRCRPAGTSAAFPSAPRVQDRHDAEARVNDLVIDARAPGSSPRSQGATRSSTFRPMATGSPSTGCTPSRPAAPCRTITQSMARTAAWPGSPCKTRRTSTGSSSMSASAPTASS